MFALERLREGVYVLRFDKHYELCMTFLRYQEFYECPSSVFRGNPFKIVDYMRWYVNDQGDGDTFSYTTDWDGFNLPIEKIKEVIDAGIPDKNSYDDLMHTVYEFVLSDSHGKEAYLIGVSKQSESEDASLLAHELSHAMYRLDADYRKCCEKIMDSFASTVRDAKSALIAKGYVDDTLEDEIQAYIATGEMSFFDGMEDQETLSELRHEIKELHARHFVDFIGGKNIGWKPEVEHVL